MNDSNSRNLRHGGILAGLLITGLGIICLLVVVGMTIARNVRVETAHRVGGGASFEWTSRDGDEKGLTVAGDEMVTDDPPEKVIEFYQAQDPNWMVAGRSNGGIKLELRDGGYRRFVVIHPKGDGTHIGVASIGSPAAN